MRAWCFDGEKLLKFDKILLIWSVFERNSCHGCPKKKCTKLWNKMKWRYVCQSTNPFHRVFSMYNYVFGQIFSPNESFEGVQPIDFRRDPLLKTRKNCPDLTSEYINSEWKLKVCSVKKLINCIQNPTTQITTTRIY